MDADSTEDTSLPGYSVPIRAPLTIDSDSEFDVPINYHVYSRTSSFNSSSSSIDISSFSDEHTSNLLDENEGSLPYPDEKNVIQRPLVRYPDENYVKERCNVSKNVIFRPFVRIPCGESSSGDVGSEMSVPIAPLTRDSDSDSEVGSIEGSRWDDSGWVSGDGSVQKVVMAPKVGSFSGVDVVDDELRVEGVFSGGDSIDMSGVGGLSFVSTESVGNEGCEVECLSEVARVSESDLSSFDLERIDARIVLYSDSEIENLNFVSTESVENEGCEVRCLDEVVKVSESDESSFGFERIDAQMVSNSDSEIEILKFVSTESVENVEVEVVNDSEVDVLSVDSERIDARAVLNSHSEIGTETIDKKVSGLDELSFDLERIDALIGSMSESEIVNLYSVSTESVENEGCEVESLNQVVKHLETDVSSFDLESKDAVPGSTNEIETVIEKPSETDEPSFDSSQIDTHIASNSDSEIEVGTEIINETEKEAVSEKERETLTKMQRVRTKFLRLALNEQLTKKVNGEGGNYKFDFDLTVLVIGKTGAGKSATINSIFGENKVTTSAFDPGTTNIQEITGNVDGIQLRVIDTPGLKCSSSDQSYNLRILKSIKRFTRKHTPNVVLYVDRLDTRDVNDSHLLTLITSSLGSSVWHSCIIALTHASCDPSGGFVGQRCRSIQEQIVTCGGDDRRVANPVWLVDNNPSYKHDIMDLDCDQANEDDVCDRVPSFEPARKPQDGIKYSVERKKAYYSEHGYRVKLVGTSHWSLGCRLCI